MRHSAKSDHVKTTRDPGPVRSYLLTLVAALMSLSCTSCQASVPVVSGSESKTPFFEDADFEAAIPSPETIIGHAIGEKAVRYDALVRYLDKVESVGQGQVILFATDPTFRTWLPAMQRLFFNAVLLGPGMGTSQPIPW